jgi:hypothetical protein
MYTANTPILGKGTVSAEAISAWFAARGPVAAQVYAPDRTYRPAPSSLGQDIIAISAQWGVNHDLMAAQISKECAYWQSRIVRDKNNPSGLGAENDAAYEKAITFATAFEGIRATAAHLMVYAVGDGDWTQYDPRYQNVKGAGWLGKAPTLAGLDGRWAFPGAGYGADIAARANDLVNFANNQTWEPPMADIPIIQMLLPVDASNTPRRSMTPLYITIHETANPAKGANAVMHGRWLLNLANDGADEPSWHFTVDDHQIVQHMPINRAGYHAGDGGNGTGNMQSIGIELCVNSDGDIQKTRDNAAWLVRKLRSETGIPADRVVQHNHWSGKDCPRLLRQSGWAAFVAAIQDTSDKPDGPQRPPDVGDPDALYIPETNTWLQWSFKAFWQSLDATLRLQSLGYPTENERGVRDGISIQRFQRGYLIYDASQPDGWQITTLPLDRYKEFGLEAA